MNPSLDLKAIDAALQLQIDLLRHSSHVEADVLKLIDEMRKELVAELSGNDLTEFSRTRLNALLKDVSSLVNEYYVKAQAIVSPTLDSVAKISAANVFSALPNLDSILPSPKVLQSIAKNSLIQGAPSAEWWKRQSLDTAFRFTAAVRQGVAQGETMNKIFKRVGATTDLAGKNSMALVHTSVMQVASDARMASIRDNPDMFMGYRHLSTLDGHTTPICIARSGMEWDMELNPIDGALPFAQPPLHWGCRSVIVGVLRPMEDFGLKDPKGLTRSSAEGQIKRDTSFEEFLKRRTVAQQNEQLGEGRAQLWRDGKITLRQLLDNRGNPLSLAQLKAKYD